MSNTEPILANHPAAGVIGLGIVFTGMFIMWLVWRKKFPAGSKRTLMVLITGIPVGVAMLYIAQWILDAMGLGRV